MIAQNSRVSSKPLVSVIVPCYNYGHFIGDALDSVLAQTFQNWECIVVNDGSRDDSLEVVSQYVKQDSRIRCVSQENSGLAASRNVGIKLSTGRYLQFLDADDLIELQKLEFQLTFLEEHTEIDIVFGGVQFFENKSAGQPITANSEIVQSKNGDGILKQLVRQNIMVVNAPLIRRSVTESVGDFDGEVKGIEDWDYWIRCAIKKKRFEYRYNNNTDALVRLHPTSMSKDSRLMLRSTLRLREKIESWVTEAELLNLNRKLAIDTAGLLGVEEVLHGSKMKGMYQLLKSGIKQTSINAKAKSLLCCSLAPFVTKQQFRQLASTSLRGK